MELIVLLYAGKNLWKFVSPDLLLHPPPWYTPPLISVQMMSWWAMKLLNSAGRKKYMLSSNKTATLQAKADCTGSAAKQASEKVYLFIPSMETIFMKTTANKNII